MSTTNDKYRRVLLVWQDRRAYLSKLFTALVPAWQAKEVWCKLDGRVFGRDDMTDDEWQLVFDVDRCATRFADHNFQYIDEFWRANMAGFPSPVDYVVCTGQDVAEDTP